MRWYQFKLKEPKRWGRRAKSDGRARPKLARVKLSNHSRLFCWIRWGTSGLLMLWVVASILLPVYLRLAQHWSSQLFSGLFTPKAIITVVFVAVGLNLVLGLWLLIVSICWCGLKRELARAAVAHRFHLCPRCGYSLQSRTDDAQPCPECGQRISRREAVRLWARFVR